MRLVKSTVWIVVAIRILISNSSGLTQRRIWVKTSWQIALSRHSIRLTLVILIIILTSYQKNTFMKPTNHRNFWGLLRLLLLGLLSHLIFLLLSLSIFVICNPIFMFLTPFVSWRTRLLGILLVFLRQYQIIGSLRLIIWLLCVNNWIILIDLNMIKS